MEMRYPLIPVIGIAVLVIGVILLHLLPASRKGSFRGGIRAANTDLAKSLPYYQKILRRRKMLVLALEAMLLLSALSGVLLLARPYRTQKVTNGVKRRDIFLCLDVSYSLYSLNYDLTDYLSDIVRELPGDRFGIVMFNTSPVVYVPMTDDYDYIEQRLDELREYFTMQKEFEENFRQYHYVSEMTPEEYERYLDLETRLSYFEAGTLVHNERRGSSLIGEGLASCLYSFPSIGDGTRTRAIIFATDNADSALAPEILRLPEACDLCRKNDVTVFGIFPDTHNYYYYYDASEYDKFREELSESVRKTGGDFYVESYDQTVSEIVSSIRSHKALTVDEIVTEQPVDIPMIPYTVLFLSITTAGILYLALRL